MRNDLVEIPWRHGRLSRSIFKEIAGLYKLSLSVRSEMLGVHLPLSGWWQGQWTLLIVNLDFPRFAVPSHRHGHWIFMHGKGSGWRGVGILGKSIACGFCSWSRNAGSHWRTIESIIAQLFYFDADLPGIVFPVVTRDFCFLRGMFFNWTLS